jgi:FHA domain
MLDPVAVALKFGFIAVLYLFLLWMARSALKDLRRAVPSSGFDDGPGPAPAYEEGTGFHAAATGVHDPDQGAPRLRVHSGAGLPAGAAYDLTEGALLGRGDRADIHLEDSFASSNHARVSPHGDVMVVEDLGSTNGTYLNGEPLSGPQPLHPGDRIRIGDSEFSFER